MSETTFTFRVDEDLKAAFAEAAKTQDRSSAQLLRVLMREAVAHQQDAHFRRDVEQSLREADDPAVRRIPHGDVRSDWLRRRTALAKRTGDDRT